MKNSSILYFFQPPYDTLFHSFRYNMISCKDHGLTGKKYAELVYFPEISGNSGIQKGVAFTEFYVLAHTHIEVGFPIICKYADCLSGQFFGFLDSRFAICRFSILCLFLSQHCMSVFSSVVSFFCLSSLFLSFFSGRILMRPSFPQL